MNFRLTVSTFGFATELLWAVSLLSLPNSAAAQGQGTAVSAENGALAPASLPPTPYYLAAADSPQPAATTNSVGYTPTNQVSGAAGTNGVVEKRIPITGKRLALAIGVGYSKFGEHEFETLHGSVLDAIAVSNRLHLCGYESVTMHDQLTNQLPTVKGVLDQMKALSQKANVTDILLVYFSGHGGVVVGEPVLYLRDGILTLYEMKKVLRDSQAIAKVIFLDACRKEPGFRTESREVTDVHVVLSCRPEETSLGRSNAYSAFTAVLLDAFNGCSADRVADSHLELYEILYYLDERVPQLAQAIKPGHSQHPTHTVVDPRSLNPVIGKCSASMAGVDQPGATNQIVAYSGPVQSTGPNDLVLTAASVGKASFGPIAPLKTPTINILPFGIDPNFEMRFANISGETSTYLVAYEPLAITIPVAIPVYDVKRRLEGLQKLLPPVGSKLPTIATPSKLPRSPTSLVGRPAAQIVEALGQPDKVSTQDKEFPPDSGTIRYDNLPSRGKSLLFNIKKGKISGVKATLR